MVRSTYSILVSGLDPANPFSPPPRHPCGRLPAFAGHPRADRPLGGPSTTRTVIAARPAGPSQYSGLRCRRSGTASLAVWAVNTTREGPSRRGQHGQRATGPGGLAAPSPSRPGPAGAACENRPWTPSRNSASGPCAATGGSHQATPPGSRVPAAGGPGRPCRRPARPHGTNDGVRAVSTRTAATRRMWLPSTGARAWEGRSGTIHQSRGPDTGSGWVARCRARAWLLNVCLRSQHG